MIDDSVDLSDVFPSARKGGEVVEMKRLSYIPRNQPLNILTEEVLDQEEESDVSRAWTSPSPDISQKQKIVPAITFLYNAPAPNDMIKEVTDSESDLLENDVGYDQVLP